MLTVSDLKTHARELGFDLCGIAPAADFRELRFLDAWLGRGYAGEMRYMARSARRRADVRNVLPSAKSVVSLGTVYNVGRPYSTEIDDPDEALASRYAWGEDYHTVLGERTEALLTWMRNASDEPFEARTHVDTGPVQERVYAQHAGLGWIGKNTCLINPELGSWLFLAEIICSLALESDPPALDQCGSCTLCLEACPTGAIVEPWVLDSTQCISYLTIRNQRCDSRRAPRSGWHARLRVRHLPRCLPVQHGTRALGRPSMAASPRARPPAASRSLAAAGRRHRTRPRAERDVTRRSARLSA